MRARNISAPHTLAVEVFEMSGTFEEASDILGDTEVIVA